MPKSYAYFGVSGDFDAKAFASSIPLEPSTCLQRHSRNPLRGIPRDSLVHYCKIKSETAVADIHDLAEKITLALEPHAGRIAAAIKAHEAHARLQIVLYFPVSEGVSTRYWDFRNA